jgi:hypothetical protein
MNAVSCKSRMAVAGLIGRLVFDVAYGSHISSSAFGRQSRQRVVRFAIVEKREFTGDCALLNISAASPLLA